MRMTPAQYRSGTYTGSLKQQLLRVVENPKTGRVFGKSIYRKAGNAPTSIRRWLEHPKTTIEAWKNSEGIFAVRALRRSSRLVKMFGLMNVPLSTVDYHWLLGVKHAGRVYCIDAVMSQHSARHEGESLAIFGCAFTASGYADRLFGMQTLSCATCDVHETLPGYARLEAEPFTAMPNDAAQAMIRGATIYTVGNDVPWEQRVTRAAATGGEWVALTGVMIGTLYLTHDIGGMPFPVAVLSGVAAIAYGPKILRSAGLGLQSRWRDRQGAEIDHHLWALLNTSPRIRAEPLVIESALESFPKLTEARVLRSLQRMQQSGHIESRIKQVIAEDGQIFDVPYYDLVNPPPKGNTPDHDEARTRHALDPVLQG